MLDNKYALLFIRGERPIMDLKYDILKHPNIKETADGGAEQYKHERISFNVATVQFDESLLKMQPIDLDSISDDGDFAILTEEEIQELLPDENEEENNNVSQKQ